MMNLGTGLGVTVILGDQVNPTEAGNTVITWPRGKPLFDRVRTELPAFLEKRVTGSPRLEDILSGRGLEALYEFLTGKVLPAKEIGKLIVAKDPTVEELVSVVAGMLGVKARDLLYHYWTPMEVLLAGDNLNTDVWLWQHPDFLGQYCDFNVHPGVFQMVTISLLTNPNLGVWGAAYHAANAT